MRVYILTVLVVLMLFGGCNLSGSGDDIVFIFKDNIVTVPEFKTRYRAWLERRGVEESRQMRKVFLYNWIYREILHDTGMREGMEYFPEIAEKVKKYRKRLIVERMREKVRSDIYSLNDGQIRKYYSDNRDKFVRDRLYRLYAVRVRDRDEAYRIKKQLQENRNEIRMFSARFSDEMELAENNGDWGLFSPDVMDSIWRSDVLEAQLGNLLGPFFDADGYYTIIEIAGYAYDRPLSFKRAYPLIIDHIIDECGRDKLDAFKDDIVKKYGVRINPENLDWEKKHD